MAETEIVEVLNIDASKANKSLGDLKKEIKDLKGQLIGLDETSEEYAKVLGEVAEKQHELNEITRKVKQANQDLGQVVANSAKALGGVTGAMNSLTGMMALFGGETGEAAEKMQQLMVAMMAITTGTSAIDAGVKGIQGLKAAADSAGGAMKLLNTIIKQNPAVAIATALVAVGSAVAMIVRKTQDAKSGVDDMNKSLETTKKLTDSLKNAHKFAVRMAEAAGKSAEEIRKINIEAAKRQWQELEKEYAKQEKAYLSANKRTQKKLHDNLVEANKMRNEAFKAYQDAIADNTISEIKERREAEEKKIEAQREAYAKNKAEREKQAEEEEEARKKKVKATEDAYEDMLDAQKEYIYNMLSNEDKLKTTVEDNHALAESMVELLSTLKEGSEEYYKAQSTMFDALRAEYDAQSQLDAIELERYQEQEERKTEIARQETEMRKQLRKTELDAALSITGSLVSIMDSYSSTLVEGSEQWKRISKAKTWISAIQGSISAMANAIESITPLPVALAVGGAASAALLASGKASCDQIDKTSMTGTTTTSGISTGINYKVSSSSAQGIANQVTNVRQTSTQSDIENLPDTKVYVLASDISRAQNQRKTTVKNSTF